MTEIDVLPEEKTDLPVVLIVDDERTMRLMLRHVLGRDLYRLEEAENGAIALEMFQQVHPDIVLMDSMMPVMNGFEACKQLKQLPGGAQTPVLMVTGLNDAQSVDRAFEAGATDYIIKPIHNAVVRQRVKRIIEASQAERALRRSEQLYRAVVQDQTELISRFKPDGTITFANEAYLRYFGLNLQQIIGNRYRPPVPEGDPTALWQAQLQLLSTENPVATYEEAVLCSQSEVCWLQWTIRLILDQYNEVREYQAVGRDITQLKQMHEKMTAAQKLADLGTLAAGVAHEINSPLQVITGLSQGLIRRLDADRLQPDYLRRKLETIQKNGWRGAEIIRSLRVYAHASTGQTKAADLNAVVLQTLEINRVETDSWPDVTIETDLAPNLPPIDCNTGQIAQILVNLLTNANDAMPGGGQIIIRTGYHADDEQVSLCVIDSGVGVSESMQHKIFDPFFTTKPMGDGMGLGLSIISGIVRAHNGSIAVHSQPGEGSTFIVKFYREGVLVESDLNVPEVGSGRFDDSIYSAQNKP